MNFGADQRSRSARSRRAVSIREGARDRSVRAFARRRRRATRGRSLRDGARSCAPDRPGLAAVQTRKNLMTRSF
eukprot:16290-Pelagococcus_subviridis.AAC.3